ncbi:MAG: DEAD/DEAH box helicase, partial [Terriglobus roseus]|nr:DEAD/DEAH box helicase [Terriglobus roseus]
MMSYTSSFYSRYIPLPKSRPEEVSGAEQTPGNGVETEQSASAGRTVEKSKKKKRKLAEVEGNSIASIETANSVNTGNADDEAAEMTAAAVSKRRKKQRPEPPQDDLPESDNRRHNAVLAKFVKSSRKAEAAKRRQEQEKAGVADEPDEIAKHGFEDDGELHDLVPLPQPSPVPDEADAPRFSVLPAWLARPDVVRASDRRPFEDLGIDPGLILRLHEHGWRDAFAIQCAVLPLLLPHSDTRHAGDVCIAAATGSGKTLAYTLPMVESIRGVGIPAIRLRALVVVPTRELVAQVRAVAELCVQGTGLMVGTAAGNRPLAVERDALVRKGQRYDPDKAAELLDRAERRVLPGVDEDDALLDDAIAPDMLPGHVPEYSSRVDILVCTPGRLVEHVQTTHGFTLDEVEWLVVDEADKLLDDSFQEWVGIVIGALEA